MLKLRYMLIGLLLGICLAWYWEAEQSTAEVSTARRPSSPEPRSTRTTAKDALTEIEGVGPTYERALNAIGIMTFAQLAEQNAQTLAARISARVTAERIQREKWIEQAQARIQ
jgi:large subunit ribosomal protein L21